MCALTTTIAGRETNAAREKGGRRVGRSHRAWGRKDVLLTVRDVLGGHVHIAMTCTPNGPVYGQLPSTGR
jgi:hypothetical protein